MPQLQQVLGGGEAPAQLVAPMLGTPLPGRSIGSMTTSATPARSTWARWAWVTEAVTRMTPSLWCRTGSAAQLDGVASPGGTSDTTVPTLRWAHSASTPRSISTAHALSRPPMIKSTRPDLRALPCRPGWR